MQDNLLIVKDVIKQYGEYTALNNANLSVPKGSIYGLLGPNGAGNTTLMRFINQITAPDSGEIIFNGVKLQNGDTLESSKVILATGHSSRDIFELLYQKEIEIQKKLQMNEG